MGLGKTVSALTAISRLMYELWQVNKALVIAPKRVAEIVWPDEVQTWDHLHALKLVTISGNEKQRKQALTEDADIYTLGRDNTAWLCGQYGGSMLPFDMLIIDESSNFKNSKSLRFKALRKVAHSFKRVVLLTGTPTPNSLLDLWPQMFLLDRGKRLGQTQADYKYNYFMPVSKYKMELRSKKAEYDIHKAIGDICISMKAKDYLELPGRVNNVIKVPFSPELREKYEDFKREKVLELYESLSDEEKETLQIPAFSASALSTKLLQFTNGAIYDEDKNYHDLHDLKLQALREVMDSAQGSPVLVAWSFRHDQERIRYAFKEFRPRALKVKQDLDDWNAGKIPMALLHPASGGHGLNLQKGGHILAWFGLNWSLELYQQMNARLDRQGQKEVTIVNKILIPGTIDMDVQRSLAGKDRVQEGLMEAVRAYIKEYI